MTGTTEHENGKFELYYRAGWAYLAVFPPQGSGRPVYPEDIENRMRLLGVPSVSARTLRQAIQEASGTPMALIEWPNGRALASELSVSIAKDGMSAYLTASHPKKGAAPPTLAELLAALSEAGVAYGIDRSALERIVAGTYYDKAVPVAAGTEPVYGRAHRIEYHFNTNRGKPYLEMDFGRIDMKELNFIENKHSGDLLASLVAPVQATDGFTVRGERIPAETDSQTVELKAGANTSLTEDGAKLHALCDGNVRIAKGAILVEPVIVVKNVNYETGNIRFDGSVVIEGGIADGFSVEAGGDIQVASGVGKARLKAGGSILLKTGINGNGIGSIECEGDLYAKYLESCEARCGGNAFVEEAVMNSTLIAGKHCVLNGKRSEVIASRIIAGASFWCKKLGNFNEAPTNVQLGVEPGLVLEYRSVCAGLERSQKDWDKTEHQLELLSKLVRDGQSDERVAQAQLQLRENLEKLAAELSDYKARQPRLRERIQASRASIAVIEDTLYKGVTIHFGIVEYRAPDAGARKIILKARDGHIVEAGFNYRERPSLDFEANEEESQEGQALAADEPRFSKDSAHGFYR
ncbi:MAG TPA: hypothetical protein DCG47_08825 [Spirochaetaceae bacterium]|jgi:uncharacterized protein (DUF342 family)|nr:hypothetical protein [Spirochaetaceae bacterium]